MFFSHKSLALAALGFLGRHPDPSISRLRASEEMYFTLQIAFSADRAATGIKRYISMWRKSYKIINALKFLDTLSGYFPMWNKYRRSYGAQRTTKLEQDDALPSKRIFNSPERIKSLSRGRSEEKPSLGAIFMILL